MSKKSLLPVIACATLFYACGAPAGRDEVDGQGTGGVTIGDDGGTGGLGELPPAPGCGDGVLEPEKEACDDGDNDDDDGCFGNCLGVDEGFTCPTAGEACLPFARCGDGIVAFPEQCDDGGVAEGDGCSPNCKFELGFKCDGAPSTCTATVCGDEKIEGAETCDDGNDRPFDGCSGDCVAEPNCESGACSSACGDGIVLGEACDDGNTLDDDGCSATCEVEMGYQCTQDTTCEKVNGECVLRVPTVFRDFAKGADFDSWCAGTAATTGLVKPALTNGKPMLNGTGESMCMTHLADWYVTKPGTNVELVSEIVLFNDGSGNYVNRWGENGEKWVTTLGSQCPSKNCPHDGNPFFFPVDGIPGALDDGGQTAAVSTSEYSMDGTTYTEQALTGQGPTHNFGFTSEVTYWFTYDADVPAKLEFLGDDDVWVFINNQLAVDLGGLHQAVKGDVTLTETKAGELGLEDGKVYEIKVFHAERKPAGSTFKLTLSNFSTGRSDCKAFCGDGIIGFGEECDDKENDGGYNECGQDCKLGSYCGDGVVDDGEECDDGNRADGDGCGSACHNLIIK